MSGNTGNDVNNVKAKRLFIIALSFSHTGTKLSFMSLTITPFNLGITAPTTFPVILKDERANNTQPVVVLNGKTIKNPKNMHKPNRKMAIRSVHVRLLGLSSTAIAIYASNGAVVNHPDHCALGEYTPSASKHP